MGLNFRSKTLFYYKTTVELSDEVPENKARLLYLKILSHCFTTASGRAGLNSGLSSRSVLLGSVLLGYPNGRQF